MTILGLDFDNTIVTYDKVFHKIALKKLLIEKTIPEDKIAIRNFLRESGREDEFTTLQGEVYGKYILEAEPREARSS